MALLDLHLQSTISPPTPICSFTVHYQTPRPTLRWLSKNDISIPICINVKLALISLGAICRCFSTGLMYVYCISNKVFCHKSQKRCTYRNMFLLIRNLFKKIGNFSNNTHVLNNIWHKKKSSTSAVLKVFLV